jgi:hypothetical protein
MIFAAEARIRIAGGALTVWGVLREDCYETTFGDGFYLHLRGLALSKAAAERLAALDAGAPTTAWHIREYHLVLEDGQPALASRWRAEEEFSVDTIIQILSEIGPNAEASLLMTGSGASGRRPGPHMRSLD